MKFSLKALRKIANLSLVISLLFSLTLPASAATEEELLEKVTGDTINAGIPKQIISSTEKLFSQTTGTTDVSYHVMTKEELIAEGLTEEQAETTYEVGRIIKEMEVTGQKIDLVNGKVTIINPADMKQSISKKDEAYIIKFFEEGLKKPKVSRKDKIEKINRLLNENPGRSEFKATFDDGSWIRVREKLNRVDTIDSDSVNTYETVETLDESILSLGNGTFIREFLWTESGTGYFTEQKMVYNFTIQNDNYDVYLNSCVGSVKSSNVFTLVSLDDDVDVGETHYDENPDIWTQGHVQVVWKCSGSVSGTLFGVFSIGFETGQTWTQIQQVAISLAARHHYCVF
ncbi:hypothetical protein [Acetivibrio straminisolvens]|jgi:hypothetical protein|uniref:hypothetical protein n=1 Tax=Acetivibrio straminisolvens TaxID=253314 RepID=UPI00235720DC|nr:hypothetical protein [Acetivibrio straminisolvens]